MINLLDSSEYFKAGMAEQYVKEQKQVLEEEINHLMNLLENDEEKNLFAEFIAADMDPQLSYDLALEMRDSTAPEDDYFSNPPLIIPDVGPAPPTPPANYKVNWSKPETSPYEGSEDFKYFYDQSKALYGELLEELKANSSATLRQKTFYYDGSLNLDESAPVAVAAFNLALYDVFAETNISMQVNFSSGAANIGAYIDYVYADGDEQIFYLEILSVDARHMYK